MEYLLFFEFRLSGVWRSFCAATDLMRATEKSGRLPMCGALKSVSELPLCRSAVKIIHYRVAEVSKCTENFLYKEMDLNVTFPEL